MSIGFEPWFKPAASALHRHKLLNTTENNIDYARPWEPMDLDADDVVGALQKKDLFGIGVWRDDLIVADPFMKLASWQTRVSPALLTNVSNMFIIIIIVRGGRCSPVGSKLRWRNSEPLLRGAHTMLGLLWHRFHGLVVTTLPCFPV